MTRFKVKFAMTDDRTGVTDEDIGDQSRCHYSSNNENKQLCKNNSSISISNKPGTNREKNARKMKTELVSKTKVDSVPIIKPISSSSFSSTISCPSSFPAPQPSPHSSLSSSLSPSTFLITDNYSDNSNRVSSIVVRRKMQQFSLSTQPCVDGKEDAIVVTTPHVDTRSTTFSSSTASLSNHHNRHYRQSGRDNPVMESCQNRTLIIDTDNGKANKKVKNSSPLTSPVATNANNNTVSSCCSSNSNYYAATTCTELLTKNQTSTIITYFLTMIMTATAALTLKSRHRQHQHHTRPRYHNKIHYQRHQSSNCPRSARTFISSVVVFLLTANCTRMITLVRSQPPPLPPAGFLDFDNLPVTRFSCEGKVIGGYYADVETGCQMFHVCTLGQKDEIQDIKFLCLNGTVFDQETRVCERVDEVECSKAEQFFDLNLDLYVPHATTQKTEDVDLEEEDDVIRPVQSKPKSSSTSTTTRATTTTKTPTPSPRTKPPSPPSTPRSRTPPVISSTSSQQQSSSSHQVEDEEEEEGEDGDANNPYTSFNYFLKTPHSHVASGYNSQSRQSYIINQPQGPSRSSNGGSNSGSGSSSSSSGGNTARKVSSASGPKTIVYTSSSVSSSSTARPKTVVVVKATLPPSKSILKPKTLATPRTTSTTTPLPPPKYELDDQYDEYYDDEDYTVEQQQAPQSSKGLSSYQYPPVSKSALISSTGPTGRDEGSYEFRDARSSKGIANAGQTIVSTGSSSGKSSGSNKGSSSIAVNIGNTKLSSSSSNAAGEIKVISSEFVGHNSTEEPYYYEDDYPDDITLQQQEQLRHSAAYGQSTPSSSGKKGSTPTSLSSSPSSVGSSKLKGSVSAGSTPSSKNSKLSPAGGKLTAKDSTSAGESDYYDDDTEVNVNAHDHHFTHVDVPRIPYAKPNVPRVLVTNGKPFLPRLRRQSHHHLYYSAPSVQHRATSSPNHHPFLLPASPSRSVQYSSGVKSLAVHQPSNKTSSEELRQEARVKAKEWGRDQLR